MNPTSVPITGIAHILPWLVEMGADEVLHDEPVNRFAAPVAQPASVAEPAPVAKPAPAPRPLIAPPPRPAINWQAVAAGAEGVAAAEALASSINSLEAYVDAINSFDAHPLKRTANRPSTMSGAAQARVLVLADRPRNAEDTTGEVLSGKHQVLVDHMLAAIKLVGFSPRENIEAVAFASFIPWRPPGNRSLTELEARMCVPLTRRLLQFLAPKLILCLGSLPGQWLGGGEEAIFKSRGKWLDLAGIPALTTFHPETLLNSPASKRLAWHDLQAFRQKLDTLE